MENLAGGSRGEGKKGRNLAWKLEIKEEKSDRKEKM